MKQSNEKGYVFLITIFTLVLISVLGLSLLTVSSNSIKTSSHEKTTQSLFYIAEAGVNYKQAILLAEIDKIYSDTKNEILANKTVTPETFENTFTQRLQFSLYQHAHTILGESYFTDHSNGKPEVQITVTQNGNPRSFTITSTGKYLQHNSSKTVQRSFEIPSQLLTINSFEVPISGAIPPSNESNIVVNNPTKDFRNTIAQAYIDEVDFDSVWKSRQNAKFKTAMASSKRHTKVYNVGVRDLFDFGQPLPPKPVIPSVVIPTLNTTNIANGTLPTNGGNITLTNSMNMPKFSNFTNRIYNIDIPSGEHSIYFKENFLNYNLASVRFNVTGNGKLNIVFDRYFELNSGRKFIINAPNTEVNIVIKDKASIRGELVGKNVYVHGRFEPTSSGKIIVEDIYLSGGVLDKDLRASVNARNIYGKNSRINISSPSLTNPVFYANKIILEGNKNDGTQYGALHLDAGAELVVKEDILIKNATLTQYVTTCLQAENIVVPNARTFINGYINYSKYYGSLLEMWIDAQTNMKKCGSNSLTISPTISDETPQTKKEYEYHFKDNNYIDIQNLVEIMT